MITILTAVICLHGVCYSAVIPTPVSYEMTTCVHFGASMAAQYAPRNWSIKGYQCTPGREV
jgi:hypothetical protein